MNHRHARLIPSAGRRSLHLWNMPTSGKQRNPTAVDLAKILDRSQRQQPVLRGPR
jgi:hypothetical protein